MAEENEEVRLYHFSVLSSVEACVRKHALFRPGDRVAIAVSGGADSVALLRALLELRGQLGIVLRVAHVHHGIRGAEADEDEQFVRQLANHFDLPLHSKRVDVPAHSKRSRLSLETGARELRYEFFQSLLEGGACDKIATAHTLDDQAETVLLRILRGTGTRGLAAIPPFRDASAELAARIVRPLLGTRREEIEQYLRSLDQPWREDASNRDPKHLRNRIRHQLLPLIEQEYNPAVRQALTNLAEIARAEEEHWKAELERLAPLLAKNDWGVVLDRVRLTSTPLALRRRLLIEVADQLDMPVGFEDIELMLHVIAHPGLRHEFEGGWTAVSSKDSFEIRRVSSSEEVAEYELPLPVPGSVLLPNGLSIRSTVVEDPSDSRHKTGTLLARDRLNLPLRVRNWRHGDRFWPLGSKQAEKLKRLFRQDHIAADERRTWPVVLSGDDIVWVRGLPVATGFEARNGPAVLIEAD